MVRDTVRQLLFLALALGAGFVGGAMSPRIFGTHAQQQPEEVVQAKRFELVNNDHEVISAWGNDKWGQVVLAFGGGTKMASSGVDIMTNQRVAIGLDVTGNGMFKFSGTDGKPRATLLLNQFQKPSLSFDDETGPRMLLGHEDLDTPEIDSNNWVLYFRPERARIGMTATDENGKTYVQGFLEVNHGKIPYPRR